MKRILIILILSIFLFSFTFAEQETLSTIEINQNITLKQSCSNCTWTNITSVTYSPTSKLLIGNVNMTRVGTEYTYLFYNTTDFGEYVVCGVSDVDGIQTPWCYNFFVKNTTEGGISFFGIGLLFIIGILCFIGFFITRNVPVKWTYFTTSILFFLTSINLLIFEIQDEVISSKMTNFFDGFTAISWYFFWFTGGLLGIMWIFTFFNTWLYKKNRDKFRRFGN